MPMVMGEDEYQFYKVETLMSNKGIHLNFSLPKDQVEVFGSLSTTHPNKYDFEFELELARP